jgi:hypothetical protein
MEVALLVQNCFAFGELLLKSTKSNQKCLLSVGPFLRQGSFTPVPLRRPAPNGHPCPDGALAASVPLDPLRETCVQPAPKSRLAVTGLFAFEDQKRIKSFPAKAGPTGAAAILLNARIAFSGTGFSREGAGVNTVNFKRAFTHQRLRLGVEEISGREDLQQSNRTFWGS